MADAVQIVPEEGARVERTVLFADIADSTGILRMQGEADGRAAILGCLDAMTDVVKGCGGTVVKRIGDELFCLFEDADAGANAATQLQQRVVEGHAKGELHCPMRIRIGLDHGEVAKGRGELFGTTIHSAKRLVDLAKAGQILTTKETLEMLSALRRRMERYYDSVVLKGMGAEQDIHELLWDTSVTMVPTGRAQRRRTIKTTTLELTYGDTVVKVDASAPSVTLGRDIACTICLEGNAVSRMHARVVYDRGKVRLEDVSTNGTAIETDCGTTHTLHHEGMELTGRGMLRCGCLGRDEDAALVRFVCAQNDD